MKRFIGCLGLSVFFFLKPVMSRESIRETDAESVGGKFPIESVISIEAGYFRNADSQDLLVTHQVDTIKISTGFRFRTGHYTLHRKTLLRFTEGRFEVFWRGPSYIARSSPMSCIYRPAWCHGNFDKDPLLEIVEMDNGAVSVYDFDQGAVTGKRKDSGEGAIDQAIGWNFDGKGEEEILALKFTWEEGEEKKNRAGRSEIGCRPLPKPGYRFSVLSLSNGRLTEVAAKEFAEAPSFGLTGGTLLSGKMVLDEGGAANPVLIEPQSDVSGSRYLLVSKRKDTGALELKRPFPHEGGVLPVGDLTFLRYGRRGMEVHGTFLNNGKGMSISKTIGNFQNGKWSGSERCGKMFPGSLSPFAIGKSHKGWIHVHEGEFQFWKDLPDCNG